MGYAVTVRVPVTRTYPSEIAIPGKLYLHVSAFSPDPLPAGKQVIISGDVSGGVVIAEVCQSQKTTRLPDDFDYVLGAG